MGASPFYRPGDPREPRICAYDGCGQAFDPSSRLQKYCNLACAAMVKGAADAARHPERQPHGLSSPIEDRQRVCALPACGRRFVPTSSRAQRYCNRACGSQAAANARFRGQAS